LKIDNNRNLGILSITSIKVVDGETAVSAAFELKKDIAKTMITVKINMAKDANDKKFERELFRATYDGEKVLKGVNGSLIFKGMASSFLKALDFEPTFPIMKVSKFWFLNLNHSS